MSKNIPRRNAENPSALPCSRLCEYDNPFSYIALQFTFIYYYENQPGPWHTITINNTTTRTHPYKHKTMECINAESMAPRMYIINKHIKRELSRKPPNKWQPNQNLVNVHVTHTYIHLHIVIYTPKTPACDIVVHKSNQTTSWRAVFEYC